MKRVLLVDECDIVRRGLHTVLANRFSLDVVGEARTGVEALAQAGEASPDVVIIGSPLPDSNAEHTIGQMRVAAPLAGIMVYGQHDRGLTIAGLIEAGARAVVLKSDCLDHVLTALDYISVGRRYYSPQVRELLEQASEQKLNARVLALSPREQQVLQFVAEGKTNKEIAYQLGVSIKTVEAHRANMMHKLSLRNTAGLVRYACTMSLVAA